MARVKERNTKEREGEPKPKNARTTKNAKISKKTDNNLRVLGALGDFGGQLVLALCLRVSLLLPSRYGSTLSESEPSSSTSTRTSSPASSHLVSTTLPSSTKAPLRRPLPRIARERASQASASRGCSITSAPAPRPASTPLT